MPGSGGWRFRLWPVNFSLSVRTLSPDDWVAGHPQAPSSEATGRELRTGWIRRTGGAPDANRGLLDWESEGGSLG